MCRLLRYAVLSGYVTFSYIASASPVLALSIPNRRDAAVSANDWDPILNKDKSATCSDLAVIFARGTFDEGNLGPWVGGPFHDALISKSSGMKVAVQGVSTGDYPADLAGYTQEGGSEKCAQSLGATIQKYSSTCPTSKIAIWGWSQGALCAHKSLNNLGGAASKVIALGVFGDPIGVWQDTTDYPPIPKNIALLSYCQKTVPDPLCTSVVEDFPQTPLGFINRLRDIWAKVDDTHMNSAQKEALKGLATELPTQALGELDQLTKDIFDGHLRRWMLTPEHFWYGIDGTVGQAADDLIRTYKTSVSVK